jgi:SnoaL-like domain
MDAAVPRRSAATRSRASLASCAPRLPPSFTGPSKGPAGAVAIVQAICDAFGRGHIAGVLGRLDPEADLQFEGPTAIPWCGRWQGHEGWMRFFQAFGATVDEIQPFTAQGDHVVFAGRYHGIVKRAGLRIDSPLCICGRSEMAWWSGASS